MKVPILYITFQLAAQILLAGNGQAGLINTQDGSAQLNISNHSANYKKDSILVICDRYDRSGAGVVLKVYHPHKDHTVMIDDIPAGKYFVTIQWLGIHHDRMEKIVKIKKGKCEVIPVILGDSQEYSKSKVFIPSEVPDFSKLKIISMK
jgi:hypothetical protein